MKFTCYIDINAPVGQVLKLFQDPENLQYWQDGFISYAHTEGNPGAVGSKNRFMYKTGGRELELIETIHVNNLPTEFTAEYWSKPMVNLMTNRFETLDENNTRYISEIEYTQFNGIMPKLMAWMFPGLFKKQVNKWMSQLKEFVENQSS